VPTYRRPICPLLLVLTLTVIFTGTYVNAQYPSFAEQPTIIEYDADSGWPQRPDYVSGAGWVSGLVIGSKDQVWFFRKGPDPVQVYTADGKFVRSWGKGLFSNPHHLRIGPAGNVWVADFGLHVVQKFTPEGKLLQTLGIRGEEGDDATMLWREDANRLRHHSPPPRRCHRKDSEASKLVESTGAKRARGTWPSAPQRVLLRRRLPASPSRGGGRHSRSPRG
jgi:hypothetical protein